MKKTLFVIAFASLSTVAGAATLKDLAGSYKITHPDLPVMNIVTISAQGAVGLTEQSPYGRIECKGKATLKNDILNSKVTCDNGASFVQKIDLSNVKNFNMFSANVYSSLYEMEAEMNFEKLK
ncbi:MAG: hypothetical protein NDI69_12935 [Bacteriovoracaceae bacterium]|nr:hypothetical protein [Bacteriovoracaceae bacterium]